MAPIWAHFMGILGQFGVKKHVFLKKNFFAPNHFFIGSQMVWDLHKPKIGPLYPPMDPILVPFVGILCQFGVEKRGFFKKSFCSKSFYFGSQMVWEPQKPKIGPLYPPMDPNWPCSGTSSRHATRLVSHIRAQPY